ncbi:MAG: response regulator [Bacteroidia bacterium]
MLVEDNADLRQHLGYVLSEFDLQTAENGAIAWHNLNVTKELPDLIISDLMMPVMDGIQLLEKLKGDDRFRHIPTIMLTAKANKGTKIRALRIGVDDYLTKPFQEEELKARINNLLIRYRDRLSLYEEEISRDQEIKKPVMAKSEADWLERLEEVVVENLNDPAFSVEFAAEKLNLSVRQFRRKVKQLTGLAPGQYIQEIRLNAAKGYLEEGRFASVKETSLEFGFNDVRYFSNLFRKRFGIRPSELLQE